MPLRSAVWISFLVVSLYPSTLFAQAKTSTRDGVYTADQSTQGKAVYDKQCAMCHGDTLQGMGQNPPLAGDDFLTNWNDQTLADLDTKIATTMPATDPGSLTAEETVQLLAYIMSSNKLPPGSVALPTDIDKLKSIHIDKPQAKP